MMKYHGTNSNFVAGVLESLVGKKLLDVSFDDDAPTHGEVVADSSLKLVSSTVHSLKVKEFYIMIARL